MLSQSTSSDLLWDACAQTLALFCLILEFLCLDPRPLLPCSGVPMLRISTNFATLSGACAHAGALLRPILCVFCSCTCPLLPCCGVLGLRHSRSSALLCGACAQALPSYPLLWAAGAQALALFHLVEGSLCSASCPLLICCCMPVLRHSPSCLVMGCLCSDACPLPPCGAVPVLRISTLFATLRGAYAQAAAVFCLVEGCLSSGTRPVSPC